MQSTQSLLSLLLATQQHELPPAEEQLLPSRMLLPTPLKPLRWRRVLTVGRSSRALRGTRSVASALSATIALCVAVEV